MIAPDVHVEDLLEGGVRNLEARTVEGVHARIGHQDVDRPELPAGLVDQVLQLVLVRALTIYGASEEFGACDKEYATELIKKKFRDRTIKIRD